MEGSQGCEVRKFFISKNFLCFLCGHVLSTGGKEPISSGPILHAGEEFKYWWEGTGRKDIIDSSFYYYCPSPLVCEDVGRQGQG